MKSAAEAHVSFVSIGLAIFAMFFGAGNLIYPLAVGIASGDLLPYGLAGFLITAVCMPLAGLVVMILFDGDYKAFFNRLGRLPGSFLIFCCMMTIGPVIAIPRIVTLSHTMIAPLLPLPFLQEINSWSSAVFAVLFLGATFLAAYKENRIITILGNFISPLKLTALAITIIKGALMAGTMSAVAFSAREVFSCGFVRGYETLDLLGSIFFSSIIISLLRRRFIGTNQASHKHLALLGLQAGLLGVGLLAVVYAGMSLLGAKHGTGLMCANAGELFRLILIKVLGFYGAALIAAAVTVACLSTSIALGAVFGEYLHHLTAGYLPFTWALFVGLVSCLPLSIFGLNTVLVLAGGPLLYVGYPVLIVLTICNIAYKLIGFTPVRIPVLMTFIIALLTYVFA